MNYIIINNSHESLFHYENKEIYIELTNNSCEVLIVT